MRAFCVHHYPTSPFGAKVRSNRFGIGLQRFQPVKRVSNQIKDITMILPSHGQSPFPKITKGKSPQVVKLSVLLARRIWQFVSPVRETQTAILLLRIMRYRAPFGWCSNPQPIMLSIPIRIGRQYCCFLLDLGSKPDFQH